MTDMWSKSDDTIVKVGTDWVRTSAVVGLEKRPGADGTRVYLRGGHSIPVPGTPDEVAAKLWPQDRS